MNISKKLFGVGFALGLLGAQTMVAMAASPAHSFPENASNYVEINFDKLPALKKLMMENQVLPETGLVNSLKLDNISSVGVSVYKTSKGMIPLYALTISEDNFNNLLKALPSDQVKTEKVGFSNVIYTYSNTYFGYKNGHLIASDNYAILHDTLTQVDLKTLAANENYKTGTQGLADQSGVLVYIDLLKSNEQALTDEFPFPFNRDLLKAIKSQSVGIVDNGGSFKITAKGVINPEVTVINYSNLEFSPSLINKVTQQNLMLAEEVSNLKSRFEMLGLTSTNEEYSNFKAEFKKNVGLDFETEVLKAFEKNSLFAIHFDENQMFPALSVVSKIDAGNADTVKKLIAAAKTALDENFIKQPSENFDNTVFELKEESVDGTNFVRFKISPPENAKNSMTADQAKLTFFDISFGLTSDNNLIITTHTHPGQLLNNTTSPFSNTDTVIEVGSVDFPNVSKYLTHLSKLIPDSFFNTAIENLNKNISPFKNVTIVSKHTATTVNSEVIINVDRPKFDEMLKQLPAVFENLFKIHDETYYPEPDYGDNMYYEALDRFSDLTSQNPYIYDINDLFNRGMIKGYQENGVTLFKPKANITRAEFTKLLVSAYKDNYYSTERSDRYNARNYPAAKFTDTSADDWYAQYLDYAVSEGLITGYPDHTFHPNAPISRAEAVTLADRAGLHNYITDDAIMSDQAILHRFSDTQKSDWFYLSSNRLYNNSAFKMESFVQDNHFEPAKLLTREEAAHLMYILVSQAYFQTINEQ